MKNKQTKSKWSINKKLLLALGAVVPIVAASIITAVVYSTTDPTPPGSPGPGPQIPGDISIATENSKYYQEVNGIYKSIHLEEISTTGTTTTLDNGLFTIVAKDNIYTVDEIKLLNDLFLNWTAHTPEIQRLRSVHIQGPHHSDNRVGDTTLETGIITIYAPPGRNTKFYMEYILETFVHEYHHLTTMGALVKDQFTPKRFNGYFDNVEHLLEGNPFASLSDYSMSRPPGIYLGWEFKDEDVESFYRAFGSKQLEIYKKHLSPSEYEIIENNIFYYLPLVWMFDKYVFSINEQLTRAFTQLTYVRDSAIDSSDKEVSDGIHILDTQGFESLDWDNAVNIANGKFIFRERNGGTSVNPDNPITRLTNAPDNPAWELDQELQDGSQRMFDDNFPNDFNFDHLLIEKGWAPINDLGHSMTKWYQDTVFKTTNVFKDFYVAKNTRGENKMHFNFWLSDAELAMYDGVVVEHNGAFKASKFISEGNMWNITDEFSHANKKTETAETTEFVEMWDKQSYEIQTIYSGAGDYNLKLYKDTNNDGKVQDSEMINIPSAGTEHNFLLNSSVYGANYKISHSLQSDGTVKATIG